MNPSSPYNAHLLERVQVAPGLAIFRIVADEGTPSFTPGQFTVLGLLRSSPRLPEAEEEEPSSRPGDRLIRRAYSISSASQQRDYLEFYVSLVTSGELTPRLFMLQAGERLFMSGKSAGVFTLDQVAPERNILLVATGTGLAPYMSMVRSTALAAQGRAMAVLQGARHAWDLGYRAELEALARQTSRFRYVPVVSRPEEDLHWSGQSGRLTPWLVNPLLPQLCGFPLDPALTDVFLCGHPDMVSASATLLGEMGYEIGDRHHPGTLHLEKYW